MIRETWKKQEVDKVLELPTSQETTDLAVIGNEVFNVFPLAPPFHFWAGIEQEMITVHTKLSDNKYRVVVVKLGDVPFMIVIIKAVNDSAKIESKIVIDLDLYKDAHIFLTRICEPEDDFKLVATT